jgi:hypothetical chaperone protein
MRACGIDFGTSNSSLGLMVEGKPKLVALEGKETSLPSALFYPSDESPKLFGRAAVEAYTGHEEGRFLRALKSILGSNLMDETTAIGKGRKSFTSILGEYLSHLHKKPRQQQAVR